MTTGVLLKNVVTPDGYLVDANGVWVQGVKFAAPATA